MRELSNMSQDESGFQGETISEGGTEMTTKIEIWRIDRLIEELEQVKGESGNLPIFHYSHQAASSQYLHGLYATDEIVDGNGQEWLPGEWGLILCFGG